MKLHIMIPLLWCVLFSAQAGDRTPILEAAGREPLPPYTYPYEDGLLATITGYLQVKDVSISDLRSYKLEIATFKKPMPVRGVIQKHTAPLAVILLGLNGHVDADFSKLWASWYAAAGCHVLLFDSTFRPEFVPVSGHGVSGNLWKETEQVAAIIDAFLKQKELRGKVTQVGISGMSYGASQALILGKMAKEGRLPFEISGIQAYSPPVRIEWTAALLDEWYEQDRPLYTLAELKEKVGGYDPSDTKAKPLSASIMRAAVAASFRQGLPRVIVRNDDYFKLNILPHGNEFDDQFVRADHAERWGFTQFAFNMALPYWQQRLGPNAIQQLVQDTHLSELLRAQPAYSETILAENDPFNPPEGISWLKANAGSHRLVLLPRGGHLGYVSEPWTKAKLLSLFPIRNPDVLSWGQKEKR